MNIHLLFPNLKFLLSLYFTSINILPLSRSRVQFMAGVETHKWNIKIICLTHIFFHLPFGRWEEGKGELIIKWFFSSSSLLYRIRSDMWMLHAQENYRKDNKWQNEESTLWIPNEIVKHWASHDIIDAFHA